MLFGILKDHILVSRVCEPAIVATSLKGCLLFIVPLCRASLLKRMVYPSLQKHLDNCLHAYVRVRDGSLHNQIERVS